MSAILFDVFDVCDAKSDSLIPELSDKLLVWSPSKFEKTGDVIKRFHNLIFLPYVYVNMIQICMKMVNSVLAVPVESTVLMINRK